jgi:hypothetical protein
LKIPGSVNGDPQRAAMQRVGFERSFGVKLWGYGQLKASDAGFLRIVRASNS